MTRICKKCGEKKPETEEYFIKANGCRLGIGHTCRTCARIQGRKYYKANKQEHNRRSKLWYEENKSLALGRNRRWASSHPDRVRCLQRKSWLKSYGLTPEDYERMYKDQNGLCKICGDPETVKMNGRLKMLHIDHCHDTGKVRGLLCDRCNKALGLLKDNKEILASAIRYLESSS